jgi:uncharacterized membrane protein YcaP (DUF421 family)
MRKVRAMEDVAPILIESWADVSRVVLVGVLAYVGLVVLLRLSGKRTLSKMNAFDFVVTVAFGSALATVLLSKSATVADAVTAFALLVLLQFLVTWSSVRGRWVKRLVTGEPRLLFRRGEFLYEAMKLERVTADEVRAAVRSDGVLRMADIEAVVMETDGSFSVVRRSQEASADSIEATSLEGVKGVLRQGAQGEGGGGGAGRVGPE